jgi:hypothetical protein
MLTTDVILLFYTLVSALGIGPLWYWLVKVPQVKLPSKDIETYIRHADHDQRIVVPKKLQLVILTDRPSHPMDHKSFGQVPADMVVLTRYSSGSNDFDSVKKIVGTSPDTLHFVMGKGLVFQGVIPGWGCVYSGDDVERALQVFAAAYNGQLKEYTRKTAACYLSQLLQLLRDHPNLTVSGQVVQLIQRSIAEADPSRAAAYAYAALTHHTLMAAEFFPLDHKLSILMPIAAPLVIPLLMTLKRRCLLAKRR